MTENERLFRDERQTPPSNATNVWGIRPWQKSNFPSPPLSIISPNNNPALSGQRDHSACKLSHSPLKVRKTRENLKQASIYADVPPPCLHIFSETEYGNSPRDGKSETATLDSIVENRSKTTVLPQFSSDATTSTPPPLAAPQMSLPGKMLHHKSVSRRMLTRVREGIANRSRSSHSVRGIDSDNRLIRRMSGKRKQSSEAERRMPSLEISRESIESNSEDYCTNETSASTCQRSFTDSTMSTEELFGSASLTAPLSMRMASTNALPKRPSSPSSSPYAESTPRGCVGNRRDIENPAPPPHPPKAVPFVDLNVTQTRSSVDVGLEREIWVAIDATVRTKVVEPSQPTYCNQTTGQKFPIDAVVWVEGLRSANDVYLTRKCIGELSSRLNSSTDRIVIVRKSDQVSCADITGWTCEWIRLPLGSNDSVLLDVIQHITPDRSIDSFSETSLHRIFRVLREHGLRDYASQIFLIHPISSAIQDSLEQSDWPTHQIRFCNNGHENHNLNTFPPPNGWLMELNSEGSIDGQGFDDMMESIRRGQNAGSITSLRLCFKPMRDSHVMEIVGQKAYKDLRPGQHCTLFLKVCIPRMEMIHQDDTSDQDLLFAELESIVGTLETNFLHIEVRYRHSLLPSNNVVTVRQVCSITRPKLDSRWSFVGPMTNSSSPWIVYNKLANLLAMQNPPYRALRVFDRFIPQPYASSDFIRKLRFGLECLSGQDQNTTESSMSGKPAVVITCTDIDLSHDLSAQQSSESSISASHPLENMATPRKSPTASNLAPESSPSKPFPTSIAFRTLTAPKTTTAVTVPVSTDLRKHPSDGPDTARQVWRHIRRSSLPAKQLIEMSPDRLQKLEASDETLRQLRSQALANKRSVGAETLAAWRWDERVNGEAPWLV